MSETSIRIAITTVDNREAAGKLAAALVEQRLAACVNIIGPIDSVYRWQEAVESTQEFLLVIKTTDSKLALLEQAIQQLHTYDTPEFLYLSPAGASDKYTRWLLAVLAR